MTENGRAVTFFDQSADDYAKTFYGSGLRSLMTTRQTRLLEFVDRLQLGAGARVLDAGCGPGYLLRMLAARGFRTYGIDAAARMVERARVTVQSVNPQFAPQFALGSIERIPYADASFDLVCSTGVIEYLQDDRVPLREAFRVLRPGGHLLLPVTNAWSPINWGDFVIEGLKRREWVRRPLNRVWQRLGHAEIRPRHFQVRRHRPDRLRESLAGAGFRVDDGTYFHFLPWPHPIDRVLPGPSAAIGNRLERFGRSWIGPLAEGYLALASKAS